MAGLYIGLMSGTSVDAVIADLDSGTMRLLHSYYQPFQPQLRDALLALHDAGRDELHRAATLANQRSHAYAAQPSGLCSYRRTL